MLPRSPIGSITANTSVANGNGQIIDPGSETASTAVHRHRRELRYLRDQDALTASLLTCTTEPKPEQLQIVALERVKLELEAKMQELRHDIHSSCDQLTWRSDMDEQTCNSILWQRLLMEHRLAATCNDRTEVIAQLERLRRLSSSPNTRFSVDGTCRSPRQAQINANLTLFLHHSTTKLPLHAPCRARSPGSLQGNIVHGAHKAIPVAYRSRHKKPVLQSHHLFMGCQADKPRYKEAQQLGSASSSCPNVPFFSEKSFNHDGQVVPAVDEFRNSFSSRVIAPSRLRPNRTLPLRSLRISSKGRRSALFRYAGKDSVDNREYGNVTIIPHVVPRLKSELLEELPSTPLPTYAQTLLNDFEQSVQQSLVLNLMDDSTPAAPALPPKRVSLSPVIELPAPLSPVKTRSSPLWTKRKPPQRYRTIFTLRLPTRSTPDSASQSTSAGSSSTSELDSGDEHDMLSRNIAAKIPSKERGLSSTRNYDLCMLDRAPDDIPECPDPRPLSQPLTASRSKFSRPLSIIRDVKDRLANLGRR
ncbi:uncharacterized protein FOMMEDRAFT_17188 [Fomitiporia mediterranea MF3/22]|uniref:uncharacterized protein n=1 Tax=Fomitiporia mediterranea (strain MF3/22) TaxID=694068 RepID=UPI00044079EB|nr:uncharacterized protein FOMMEDRAFT_17188 [Fomitiporia mediterranea MF3/22]EJD06719.1 hypothetical protein FOMMEDRAFT_17188 [Fomitiporia mediterranea MF3/22]